MITTADFLDFDYFPVKDETAERSPTLTLKCQHVLPACFATSLNFSVLKNSSEICTGVIKSTVIALIFLINLRIIAAMNLIRCLTVTIQIVRMFIVFIVKPISLFPITLLKALFNNHKSCSP